MPTRIVAGKHAERYPSRLRELENRLALHVAAQFGAGVYLLLSGHKLVGIGLLAPSMVDWFLVIGGHFNRRRVIAKSRKAAEQDGQGALA